MQARHAPTEEHRNKKKFQPSIRSYFEVRDYFEDNDDLQGLDPTTRPRHQDTRAAAQHQQQQQHRERLAPDVPEQVQAGLLSVGMRVRKSVPEGYKMHKMSGSTSIQTPMSRPTLAVKPPREAVPDEVQHQRELLPFCGLHNIGGFAEQPTTNPHLYTANATPSPPNYFPLPAETFTQPFSSTASTDSGCYTTSKRPHNPSKRSWQDEDQVRPLDTSFFFGPSSTKGMGMGVEVDEVPVSPLSEAPPLGLNMLPPVRQFAQPKSRRAAQRTISDDDIDMDFENASHIEVRVSAGCVSDFDETDFLSNEVDMGGI